MKPRGFTLLETLTSIFIIAIIGTIFAYAFSAFRESNDLQTSYATIVSVLKDARARTLSSNSNSVYGVHFEASKAVLFKGSVYNSSDASNEPYILPPTIQISSINLSGGAAEVVFTRLEGTTTASGTVTLSPIGNSSKIHAITIFSTGNVQ